MGKYIDGNGLSHFMGILKGIHQTFVTNVAYDTTNNLITMTKNGTSQVVAPLSAAGASGSYNDLLNKPTIPSANSTATNIKMDGTQSAGSLATFAKADHVHPTDTSRVPTTRKVNGKALSADVTLAAFVSSTDVGGAIDEIETFLDGMESGAQVNQNAFSNVKVGSTTVEADTKTDTLELVAGSNVTLTPDATNDKVTIASSYTDTKNTAGSTDSSSKLFIIGATSQAANPQTYSQDTAYVGTDGHLYSNSVQVVNLSGSQALTNKTYNGYTLAAACAKGVDTSISSGSTSTNVPTTAAVVNYMTNVTGALVYQGTVGTGGTVSDLPANHTKGWYYIVKAAGTFAGIACEAGDMIICNTSGTSANSAHWDVVQSNLEVLSNSEIDALWAAA